MAPDLLVIVGDVVDASICEAILHASRYMRIESADDGRLRIRPARRFVLGLHRTDGFDGPASPTEVKFAPVEHLRCEFV